MTAGDLPFMCLSCLYRDLDGPPLTWRSERKRARQAARVARIYRSLQNEGVENAAVKGDFNDDPSSQALAPLLHDTDLRDASCHQEFDWKHRKGTYGGGNEKDKVDNILLSPALYGRMTGAGVPQGCLARQQDA